MNQLHWIPAVAPFRSTRPADSALRVAAVLSERLLYGLRHSCALRPLPEAGAELHFAAEPVDVLLLESCLFAAGGDWRQALGPSPNATLRTLIARARSAGVPVVFWMTADIEYLPLFRASLELCDLIGATDPRVLDELGPSAARALALGPAVEPRLFNPLRPLPGGAQDFAPLLLDGTRLAEDFTDVATLLRGRSDLGFTAFERDHVPSVGDAVRLRAPHANLEVAGRLSQRMLPEVLKHAAALICHGGARTTPTETAWRAVENAACMCATLRLGARAPAAVGAAYLQDFADPDALAPFLSEAVTHAPGFAADALQRWRRAFSEDTFEQRLLEITARLGIGDAAPAVPLASIVTPTMRPERLDLILANFARQHYARKELVIAVNGPAAAASALAARVAHRDDVRVTHVPGDHYAATTLNQAASLCRGEFLFRFDDDDDYGAHYVSDSLLMLQAEAADLLGKFGVFVKLRGDGRVFQRRRGWHERSLRAFRAADLAHPLAPPSGATFALRLDLWRRHAFPDASLSAADSAYLEHLRRHAPDTRIVLTDSFNYTIGRDVDSSAHTWRVEPGQLVDGAEEIPSGLPEVAR